MDKRWRVYIAGPYSNGNTMENIGVAINCASMVASAGMYPFIPHLTGFWDMISPGYDYEFFMDQDDCWLEVCDALIRLHGHSPGADREVARAQELGLPVIHFQTWFEGGLQKPDQWNKEVVSNDG